MNDPVRMFEALAHETRLGVFRLLIPAGPDGMPAGRIGEALGLAPNALSFHLSRLSAAGLIRARRDGRRLFYAVEYARLARLTEFLAGDCCAAAPDGCIPDCPGGGSARGLVIPDPEEAPA